MGFAGRTLNRWLEGERWARERLAAHAGRRFAIGIGPATQIFAISAEGMLDGKETLAGEGPLAGEDPATTACDLRLEIFPLSVPAFLADPGRWDELVTAEGDAALAHTLKELSITLPWFVERSFADALGPIVGKRVADAGRRALAVPGYVATRLVANVASYARDESQLLAHPSELGGFTHGVETMAERAEAIEERIRGLEAKRFRG